MTSINVEAVEAKAREFNCDVEKLNKELKRLASLKCNWLKKKGKPEYKEKLENLLAEYQLVTEAKAYVVGRPKFVTYYEQEDVSKLTYDETAKALETIRSKKSNTRWLTDVEGDNDEFRNACRIEQMLLEHKKLVKPIEDNTVRKTDIQKIIDLIETTGQISTDKILEELYKLM